MCARIAVLLVCLCSLYSTVNGETDGEPFLPKCCPDGMMGFPELCYNSSEPLLHPFKPMKNMTIRYRPLECSTSMIVLTPDEFELDDAGNLRFLVDTDSGDITLPSSYCLDVINPDSPSVVAFECIVEEEPVPAVYPFGMLVSIPLLAVTAIVYSTVKRLRNVNSKCLVAICVCLCLAYTFLVVIQLFTHHLPERSCLGLGFAVQFFFLATFFWLNVMCIDIYWAFSDLRSLGGSGGSWRDKKKLLCYSVYAWGMPLLILSITIAVDYSPSIPTTSRFKPAMGLDKCFFRGRIAGWTYFYGPMAVILLINCVLFAITAFHLYRHRRNSGVLRRGDSRRHGGGNDKERFNLYLKLFIVMGINWLFEVISFTFNKDVPSYFWYITDITNTLQGVFIFLIFVWKQRLVTVTLLPKSFEVRTTAKALLRLYPTVLGSFPSNLLSV